MIWPLYSVLRGKITTNGDHVFADILAVVIAATHLHDDNDFAKLAVDLDITEPDDVIREKRNCIVTKGELDRRFLDLDGAEDRDSGGG